MVRDTLSFIYLYFVLSVQLFVNLKNSAFCDRSASSLLPWISEIIFFPWLDMLLIASTLVETVVFGLEEPWSPQIIQRIIPWQIILNEAFPKPPAFCKVSLLCDSESSHISALAGGGIPKGRDGGGRSGCHVVGMSAEGTACHTPAWGSAVPQVNILMSNFHSVVFSQHMGFKKQLKENCTHLLISEACDFRRVCQINFHI